MKIKSSILLLTSALLLCGCGSNDSSSISEEINPNALCVKVVKPDGTPFVDASVLWCEGSQCYMPVELNSNGVAYSDFDALEGVTYTVHLQLDDDSNYAYNPNIYSQTIDNKELVITLSEYNSYISGDGSKYIDDTNQGPFVISEGINKVNVVNKNEIVYFSFAPNRSGIYRVSSWAQIGDIINPYGEYNGNVPSFLTTVIADKDISDTNKNFTFEFEVTDDVINDQGQAKTLFSFGFSANLVCSYPIELIRVSDCHHEERQETTSVNVTEHLSKFQDMESNLKDFELLNEENLVYNSVDRFYHLNSNDGPLVVAHIDSANPYVFASLSHIQDGGNKTLLLANGTLDYSNFVAEYAKYCNSDGVYPLTEEFKNFLILLSESQGYFDENGWILSYLNSDECYGSDYVMPKDAIFLFDCGYYVEEEVVTTDVLQLGENLISVGFLASEFPFTNTSENDIHIFIYSNDNRCLIIDGDEQYIGGSLSKGYDIYVEKGETIKVSVASCDIVSSNIVVKINIDIIE